MDLPEYIQDFQNLLGPERVITAGPALERWSLAEGYRPAAVLFPEEAGEVQSLIRIADKKQVPLFPAGSGSRLRESMLPFSQGVVVCLRRLQRIRDLDGENLTVEVEAGVTNQELNRLLETKGLLFPPDPDNLEVSTLGGHVATNAFGPKRLGYGTTRDYLLGLEFVTAQGDLLRFGGKNLKNVAGYDVARFMAGSRGALGIITAAIFKLRPLPEAESLVLLSFPGLNEALNCAGDLRGRGINPVALEFLDQRGSLALGGSGYTLFLALAGVKEAVAKQVEEVLQLSRARGLRRESVVTEKGAREAIWGQRRTQVSLLTGTSLKVALLVPPREELAAISEANPLIDNTSGSLLAHLGTGRIEVMWIDDPGGLEAGLPDGMKRLLDIAQAHGGLGWVENLTRPVDSKTWLQLRGAGMAGLTRRLKEALDPNGILVPTCRWVQGALGES